MKNFDKYIQRYKLDKNKLIYFMKRDNSFYGMIWEPLDLTLYDNIFCNMFKNKKGFNGVYCKIDNNVIEVNICFDTEEQAKNAI